MAIITDVLQLRRNAAQSIDGDFLISWDTEEADASGYWTSGDPKRIIVPAGKGGDHLFTCIAQSTGAPAGARMFITAEVLNSSDVSQRTCRGTAGGKNNYSASHLSLLTRLNDGDRVQFYFYLSASGYFTVNPNTRLDMVRLG